MLTNITSGGDSGWRPGIVAGLGHDPRSFTSTSHKEQVPSLGLPRGMAVKNLTQDENETFNWHGKTFPGGLSWRICESWKRVCLHILLNSQFHLRSFCCYCCPPHGIALRAEVKTCLPTITVSGIAVLPKRFSLFVTPSPQGHSCRVRDFFFGACAIGCIWLQWRLNARWWGKTQTACKWLDRNSQCPLLKMRLPAAVRSRLLRYNGGAGPGHEFRVHGSGRNCKCNRFTHTDHWPFTLTDGPSKAFSSTNIFIITLPIAKSRTLLRGTQICVIFYVKQTLSKYAYAFPKAVAIRSHSSYRWSPASTQRKTSPSFSPIR